MKKIPSKSSFVKTLTNSIHTIRTTLVKKMLCTLHDYYGIDIQCNAQPQDFYQQFEMLPATGMILRNYDNIK